MSGVRNRSIATIGTIGGSIALAMWTHICALTLALGPEPSLSRIAASDTFRVRVGPP
jgi:hypothetical protein